MPSKTQTDSKIIKTFLRQRSNSMIESREFKRDSLKRNDQYKTDKPIFEDSISISLKHDNSHEVKSDDDYNVRKS